jgi:hypothetical protein
MLIISSIRLDVNCLLADIKKRGERVVEYSVGGGEAIREKGTFGQADVRCMRFYPLRLILCGTQLSHRGVSVPEKCSSTKHFHTHYYEYIYDQLIQQKYLENQ